MTPGLNLEALLTLSAEISAKASEAQAKETPLTQREKELRDAYNRGYLDGIAIANDYSWRV